MKPTEKQIKNAKEKAKKIQKKDSTKRIEEVEEIIILMDAKITSLENEMKSLELTHERLKSRLGL